MGSILYSFNRVNVKKGEQDGGVEDQNTRSLL